LNDIEPPVRLAATTAVGLVRAGRAFDRLTEMVRSDTAPIRREAATALGRLDQNNAVPALLDSLRQSPDRFLEHALVYAMIRLADVDATLIGLADTNSTVVRGSLIALDQMEGGRLTLDLIRPSLDAAEPGLRQEALRIVAKHPEWAGQMAETL